jgi:hypothetical protein
MIALRFLDKWSLLVANHFIAEVYKVLKLTAPRGVFLC